MDKQVLLPTDFSKNALNAVSNALDLYADQKCDFYFINVYQVEPWPKITKTHTRMPRRMLKIEAIKGVFYRCHLIKTNRLELHSS